MTIKKPAPANTSRVYVRIEDAETRKGKTFTIYHTTVPQALSRIRSFLSEQQKTPSSN